VAKRRRAGTDAAKKQQQQAMLTSTKVLALLVQKYKYWRSKEAATAGNADEYKSTCFTGAKVQMLTQHRSSNSRQC
jgi:hypothetical protein